MKHRWKPPRALVISLLSVLLGFIAGAVVMLCFGKNPLEGYYYLLKGAFMSRRRVGDTLSLSVVLILTGASVAFAGRANLFNIGASGQMLMGGFAASLWAYYSPLPRSFTVLGIFVIGAAAGALWGMIPGALKSRFHINEVVSAILLNWVAFWTVDYCVKNYFFKSPGIHTISRMIPPDRSLRADFLTRLFGNDAVNLGLLAAMICLPAMSFILNRTVPGYELKTVGLNRHAAEYAGIRVGRVMILAFAVSGAFAGLAGVSLYIGYALDIQTGLMPQQGYDGIAIALVGQNTPIGVLLSGLLFGIIQSGKNFMTTSAGIRAELADIVVALIIYFSAISALVGRFYDRITAFFTRRRSPPPSVKNTKEADSI